MFLFKVFLCLIIPSFFFLHANGLCYVTFGNFSKKCLGPIYIFTLPCNFLKNIPKTFSGPLHNVFWGITKLNDKNSVLVFFSNKNEKGVYGKCIATTNIKGWCQIFKNFFQLYQQYCFRLYIYSACCNIIRFSNHIVKVENKRSYQIKFIFH